MSEWKQISLGNLVESISKRHAFNKDRLIFLNTSDIFNGKVLNNEYTDINTLPGQAKKSIQKNDILFSEIRPANRRFAYIDFESEDYVVSTKLMVIRPKNNDILPKYLYYFLTSEESLRHLQEVAESRSGTFPQITFSEVKEMVINLPPLKEQQRIVEVIDSLTEKIELNLKINETLEEMAMTLYKHWFVDFGPFQDGEFVDSELGMIPKGWKVIQVKDLGEVITGKTPSTKVKEYYGDKIPFIKIPDMHGNVYIVKTETMLSELGAQSQKNKMLPPNTVCVSCIATPGLVVLTSEMSQTNQQINSVVCKEGVSPYFVYLFFKSISDNIVTLGSGGTATLNLNKGDFSRIKLLMPTNEVMTGFNNKVESIFNLIKINSLNNIELENLRDYLLPRLLSGEIDVSKAEKQVEEVL